MNWKKLHKMTINSSLLLLQDELKKDMENEHGKCKNQYNNIFTYVQTRMNTNQ